MIWRTLLTSAALMVSVMTDPSRWPFPMAAFSTNPVLNRTLSFGLVPRAASATLSSVQR